MKWISLLGGALLTLLTLSVSHAEVVSFNVRELGRVRVNLNVKREFGAVSGSDEFFQGEAHFTSHKVPAAAVKRSGTWSITFPGRVTGAEKRRSRLYTVRVSKDVAKVSSVPSSRFVKNKCAESHYEGEVEAHSLGKLDSVEITTKEAVKVISLRAYTDPDWQKLYGANASSEVLQVINVAESIYNRQLGIRFRVISITHLSSSFPSTAAGDLLNEFRLSPESKEPATLQSLFTGKDIDGGTAGIAYVGVVCYAPEYSYSVIQSYGTLTGRIFAHEIGHNLGATHDTTNAQSLMYPMLSSSQTGFSEKSLSQIQSHLGYFGECLSSEYLTPLLTGSKLTIKKSKKSVKITLLSSSGTPIDTTRLVYSVNGKFKAKETALDGSISVKVKVKGKVTVTAKVQAEPTVSSKAVLRF